MKKLGFSKKDKDDGEDSNRPALFSSRSKTKSSTPSGNPYAQPMAAADPYTQAKMNVGAGGLPSTPKPSRAEPYGEAPSSFPDRGGYGSSGLDSKKGSGYGGGGYGSARYGAQSGYGEDRYGSTAGPLAASNGASRYGAGGYGGLGGNSGYDDGVDEARDALFGEAKGRLKQPQQQNGGYGQPPPYEEGEQSGINAESSTQGYGAYGDRQLTAEEEEEEDIQATKQQIRFMVLRLFFTITSYNLVD